MNKIERYSDGVLIEAIPYTAEEIAEREVQIILNEISRLEAQITSRRTREAILGIDNGWLANQESLIAIERAKL